MAEFLLLVPHFSLWMHFENVLIYLRSAAPWSRVKLGKMQPLLQPQVTPNCQLSAQASTQVSSRITDGQVCIMFKSGQISNQPSQAMQPCWACQELSGTGHPPTAVQTTPRLHHVLMAACQPRVSQASGGAVTQLLATSQLGCPCSEADEVLLKTCMGAAWGLPGGCLGAA